MAWDDFWSFVTDHRYHVQFGLLFSMLLLVFTAFSLANLEPGTKSHTMALVDLILVAALACASGGTLWYSARWEQKQ